MILSTYVKMKRGGNMNKRKDTLTGWLFIAPMLIAFLIFVAFPFFASLGLSFTKWNFIGGWKKLKWIGLENFEDLLGDGRFLQAINNTFVYAAATVPTSIIAALGLAYLLNNKVYFKKTLRMAFFIPYISNTVALAAVFKFLFNREGIINRGLNALIGMEPLNWMTTPSVNKIPVILLVVWTAIGYELVIYMAALQNVPKNLYEAADIDGATGWSKFWKITFPMISPTTFYLCIVRFIAVFKIFSSVNIMTLGTSQASNTSIVQQIYTSAFSKYQFGYASAQAMVLFVMILIITRIQFFTQKKWVHY